MLKILIITGVIIFALLCMFIGMMCCMAQNKIGIIKNKSDLDFSNDYLWVEYRKKPYKLTELE